MLHTLKTCNLLVVYNILTLNPKGPELSQNFADDLHIGTLPVFNDAFPYCKL